jgi:hypothetical protein
MMSLRRKRKRSAPVSADEGSGVTSIRFQPDLRRRLEQEAKRNDQSFSSEVQGRLRRSFEDEKLLASQFGSERNARIMQIAGSVMQMQKNPLNPDADWLDDPITFLLARNALLDVSGRLGKVEGNHENGSHVVAIHGDFKATVSRQYREEQIPRNR